MPAPLRESRVKDTPTMNNNITTFKRALLGLSLGALASVAGQAAFAQSPEPVFSVGPRFQESSGEAIYRATCQGCHMAQGQGAKGAGAYPALASNPRLASAEYPLYVVINGQKGMPAFGKMLSDEQIASVVGYARTHFGNQYPDAIAAESVKKLRP
jgi:mono/diheme cytochrome c family protein